MQHQALLENYLRQLRLPTFAQNYQTFAQDAARTNLSFERYLLAHCQAEAEQRQANRIERAIINAKFPVLKELTSFDFSLVQGITKTRVLELSQGGYMSRAENIILMGNPGLGKSHIATGLALAACRQGKRVRFFGVASLVNDMLAANRDLRLSRFIKPFTRLDLVVLDELGFLPFSKDGGQVLFQLCSDLHERVSIIITTNLRFADWNSIFADEIMTTSLLDRLTSKGHILEFVGESYRFRQRAQMEEQAASAQAR
jgi:DNA replication protein DnaC